MGCSAAGFVFSADVWLMVPSLLWFLIAGIWWGCGFAYAVVRSVNPNQQNKNSEKIQKQTPLVAKPKHQ